MGVRDRRLVGGDLVLGRREHHVSGLALLGDLAPLRDELDLQRFVLLRQLVLLVGERADEMNGSARFERVVRVGDGRDRGLQPAARPRACMPRPRPAPGCRARRRDRAAVSRTRASSRSSLRCSTFHCCCAAAAASRSSGSAAPYRRRSWLRFRTLREQLEAVVEGQRERRRRPEPSTDPTSSWWSSAPSWTWSSSTARRARTKRGRPKRARRLRSPTRPRARQHDGCPGTSMLDSADAAPDFRHSGN